jgi:magnesium chelatase subunit I
LRVLVDGLTDPAQRLEVYHRVRMFREHPHRLCATLGEDTVDFGEGIARARDLLSQVDVMPGAERVALHMIQKLEISSHRAEITLLEAARAYAAADERNEATVEDVTAVAPMALRQRRSRFIHAYFEAARAEEAEIDAIRSTATNEPGAGKETP